MLIMSCLQLTERLVDGQDAGTDRVVYLQLSTLQQHFERSSLKRTSDGALAARLISAVLHIHHIISHYVILHDIIFYHIISYRIIYILHIRIHMREASVAAEWTSPPSLRARSPQNLMVGLRLRAWFMMVLNLLVHLHIMNQKEPTGIDSLAL